MFLSAELEKYNVLREQKNKCSTLPWRCEETKFKILKILETVQEAGVKFRQVVRVLQNKCYFKECG